MTNISYEEIWTKNFNNGLCIEYDKKFFSRFEKNIKHLEQLKIINKYSDDKTVLLDFPVGTARVSRYLKAKEKHGYDISDEFIAFVKKFGYHTNKVNLTERIKNKKFNLVITLHTLFAFKKQNQLEIIKNLSTLLKKNGIMIFDTYNKDYFYNDYKDKKNEIDFKENSLTTAEIIDTLSTLGLKNRYVIPHDILDNKYLIDWLHKKKIYNIINRIYFIFKLGNMINFLIKYFPQKYYMKKIYIFEKV